MGEARSVEEMDDARRPTEDDERVLEVIRRQLDRQYPASPRKGRVAKRSWDDPGNEEAEQKRRPWNRARLTWIVVGTLLLTCAAGGVAGALATLFYFKNANHPVVADPPRSRPGPEAEEPPSTAEAPILSSSASQASEDLTVADVSPVNAPEPTPSGLTVGDVSPLDAKEPAPWGLTVGDVSPGRVQEPAILPTPPPRAAQAP